jgi:subtilisin family serine protease
MRAPLLVLLLFLMVAFAAAGASAHPYMPEEIILSFGDRATEEERARVLADLGAASVRHLDLIDADVVALSSLTVDQALAVCRKSRAVAHAEPNYRLSLTRAPNDPLFPDQWSLHNTGESGGAAGADICALDAWDLATGSRGVLVAVLDTGVDLEHPDLAANLFVNSAEVPWNGDDDDGNGFVDDVCGWDFRNDDAYPFDDHGHGTHCAGVVGAVGDNGLGTAGVAWEVSILPLKLMNQNGVGYASDAIDCIGYSIAMGADVMNASWCGGPYSSFLEQAIWGAASAGVLFVAAAGNGGHDNDAYPVYPACYEPPNIISVAATDEGDALADEVDWGSNYGATTVDIAAPGKGVWSTAVGGGQSLMSGTSCAVPHVVGVLALMLADSPGTSAEELKARLLASAEPVPGLEGMVASGGRLNAHAALAGPDSIPPGPLTDLSFGEVASTRADLSWTAVGDDGSSGIASAYDVRFDVAPVTEATFQTAPQAAGPPAPAPAGSLQMFRVVGLSPGRTWHFAIKTFDEYGNASAISNPLSCVTLGPPAASVRPDSIAATALSGETAAVSLRMMNVGEGVLDWEASVVPTVSWLALEVEAGAVAAGESSLVAVELSTAGMPAGAHNAEVVLVTNDPEGSLVEVPVRFEIIGVPNIETGPDLVDFGELYVSSSAVESVLVWNSGTGTLNVEQPVVEGEGFETSAGPFALEAGASRNVGVGFSPVTSGVFEGVLSLTCNDPDVPLVDVPLLGTAIDPPAVAVGPDSFAVSFSGDESPERILEIENHGGSPLDWTIDREVSLGDTGAAGARLLNLTGTVIGRDRHHGEYANALWSLVIGDLVDRGASVIEVDEPTTPAVLESVDVLWITDCSESWTSQEVGALGAWVRSGGGLLLEGDEMTSTASYNAILREAQAGIVYSSADGMPGTTTSVSGHVVTAGVDSVYLYSNSASILAADPPSRTVVRDQAGAIAGAVSIPGRGRIVAVSDEVFHDGHVAFGHNRRFANRTFDWLALGVDWLALDRVGGTLAAGGAETVGISLGREGIQGGEYRTELHVATNDPETPDVLVGVVASVVGFPSIAPSDSLLDFGDVFVSASAFETLTVTNDGTDSLVVSSLEVCGGGFFTTGAPFSLWVEEARTIEIGLSPESEGARSGSLFVHSNDADQPAAVIRLVADAVLPPDILVVQSSLDATVLSDLGDTLDLLVENVGVAELIWEASTGPDRRKGAGPRTPEWLSVVPESGATPSGTTDVIEVVFDATDMAEGEYEASVILETNDPDESSVHVPVVMSVVPTADISVVETGINFGAVVVGWEVERQLEVTNDGTAPLHVRDITTSDEAFSAEPTSFSLDVGQIRDVDVTFAPLEDGTTTAQLVILSDDPDEGTFVIDLLGRGLLAPDVNVSPEALEISLDEGTSSELIVSIENAGAGQFRWDLDITTGTGQTGDQDLHGVTVMWDRSHGQSVIGCISDMVAKLENRGAVVMENHSAFTPEVLRPYDVVWSGRVSDVWTRTEREALTEWVGAGGALLLTSDADHDVHAFNELLLDLGEPFSYNVMSGFSGATDRVRPHCITRDVSTVHLGSNSARLAAIGPRSFRLVDDVIGFPNTAGSSYGEGRIIAVAEQLFEDWSIWREDNAAFAQAVFDWLVFGVGWLEPGQWAGAVTPGASSDLWFTADASGLDYGAHEGSVVVMSNDPDESSIVVPVELLVTGGSELELSDISVRFPDTYHTATSVETLVIGNSGTEPLLVHSISVDHECFEADTTSFEVAVGREDTLMLSFFAETPGSFEAELIIESNDQSDPVVAVPLSARAVPTGMASISPASLSATVLSGQAETLAVFLENVGSSALLWAIGARDVVGADADGEPVVRYGGSRRIESSRFAGGSTDPAWKAPGGAGLDRQSISVGWISFVVEEGMVSVGGTMGIQVVFDSEGLAVGGHAAEIVLETDDPWRPATVIPVAFDVADSSPAAGAVDASFCDGAITVRWSLPVTDGILGLNVYRSVDDGQTYQRLNEITIGPSPSGEHVDDGCWPGDEFWYDVRAVVADTLEATVGPGPVAVRTPGDLLTALHAARPNPFTARTELTFDTPETGRRVVVRVCDVAGRLVRTLYDGRPHEGRHVVEWDGRSESGAPVAAGVYLVFLDAGGFTRARKVVRLR